MKENSEKPKKSAQTEIKITPPIDTKEPVKYLGDNHTANNDYHDGQMKPAIGVHNFQIMRANRSYPEKSDGLGWTYNHAPNLAYWNNTFYCHYLSNPTGEHIPPGATLIATSKDGQNWSRPTLAFPIYFTAQPDASIDFTFMHQRMGFYVAPNGRLLTMGFYGDHTGEGTGRVVREIYENNEFGPIYFIRVNNKWEKEVKFPLYSESSDKGFVEACEAFLNDKVRRMQWWEEHRLEEDREALFKVPWLPTDKENEPGQAFAFYTLHNGSIMGFFKSRWVTHSCDEGETWTQPIQCNTLTYGGGKIWPQRLNDGRFALVYNPTNSMARHPLSIATSDDGIHFNNLLNVHSEISPKRFWGREKRPGPQYVRGIVEGNGNPPGDAMWVVYSVSKEDIWISRIPVPVQSEINGPIADNFNQMELGSMVPNWNIYAPKWCPIEIGKSPDGDEHVLVINDYDPYDYAKAVRVFQKTEHSSIRFQLYVEANPEQLAIEVVSANGARCVQIQFEKNSNLMVKNDDQSFARVSAIPSGQWTQVEINTNTPKQCYDLHINGTSVAENHAFAAEGHPERIIFRTGAYRLQDNAMNKHKSGDAHIPGWDEPEPDEMAPKATFYIKDFSVSGGLIIP